MNTPTKKKVIRLLTLVIFLSLACNPVSAIRNLGEIQGEEPPPDQPATEEVQVGEVLPEDDSLSELTGAGVLESEDITSNGEGTQGGVIRLQIRNRTSEAVVFTIPCGFIFTPANEEEQRMMVIQPVEETVEPDGDISVEPYVVCIDSGKSAPGTGSGYLLGSMASGDLLTLAECICNEDLSDEVESFEDLGVQFAVWAVSDGVPFSELGELPGAAEGALGDLLGGQFGGELGEDISELLQGWISMFQVPAQYWLDRCGIELEK